MSVIEFWKMRIDSKGAELRICRYLQRLPIDPISSDLRVGSLETRRRDCPDPSTIVIKSTMETLSNP
jgi:hypothetical protein